MKYCKSRDMRILLFQFHQTIIAIAQWGSSKRPIAFGQEIPLTCNEEELNVPRLCLKLTSEIHSIDDKGPNEEKAEFVITNNAGTIIPDCSGTRGLSFWVDKNLNSRILWAVPHHPQLNNDESDESDRWRKQGSWTCSKTSFIG
uniref:Uncharacterized protein n=1 Tax=Romanomermis culicivorax TaxID=13658 RepID=A0A915K6X3_ROMCU